MAQKDSGDDLQQRRKPFVQLPCHLVWELDNYEFRVLSALACYANREGICWPSIRKLAARLRYGQTTVIRTINRLVERGYLSIERRNLGSGSRDNNRYRIAFEGVLSNEEQVLPSQEQVLSSGEQGCSSAESRGAPTAGAEEDPYQPDPYQPDPLPPTPSPADPGVGVGDSPSAPSEPEQPGVPVVTDSRSAPTDPAVLVEMGDRLTLNRMTLEWETRPGEPFDWFVDYQMRVLPQKPDKATMRRNALSYIRKARTLPERYAQVRDEFGLAKAEQEEKQRQAELAESLDDYFRRQRYGYG